MALLRRTDDAPLTKVVYYTGQVFSDRHMRQYVVADIAYIDMFDDIFGMRPHDSIECRLLRLAEAHGLAVAAERCRFLFCPRKTKRGCLCMRF